MTVWRITALAVGYVVGIIWGKSHPESVPVIMLLSIGLIGGVLPSLFMYLRERKWRETHPLLIALSALIVGLPVGIGRVQYAQSAQNQLGQLTGAREEGVSLTLTGTIVAEPETRKGDRVEFHFGVTSVEIDGMTHAVPETRVLVRAYLGSRSDEDDERLIETLGDPGAYGYSLAIKTKNPTVPKVLNPGGFDQTAFLRQQGCQAQFRTYLNQVTLVSKTRGNPVVELALAIKTRFLKTMRRTVRDPVSRLAAAATLGARRSVEGVDYYGKDIQQMFRHAGVGHVLAVSGLHVSIVSLLLFSTFRMTGLRPRQFAPALVILLALFAIMTGARPSSVRAAVMNSVIIVAFAYFRYDLRKATFIGLAVSSLLILGLNPLVLYSPSFLLSFGAVLSLVLITPTVDRQLSRLCGASLIFSGVWFVGMILMACVHMPLLTLPASWLVAASLLWLAIMVGDRLNHQWPLLWSVNLTRLPKLLRMFFSAQLSIQIGMMIPTSAWFFGQFPVAGMFVNLLAIPLVGVLVQLGILIGTLGQIPVVGMWLAYPLGAALYLCGQIFYGVAWLGAEVFPYPAVPKPTLSWIVGYYCVVGACLSAGVVWRFCRPWVYGLWLRNTKLWNRLGIAGPAVAVLAAGCLAVWPGEKNADGEVHLKHVGCLAVRQYPVVYWVDSQGSAVVIGAGAGFTGKNSVFQALRNAGATHVSDLLIPGFAPEQGTEGAVELMEKIPVTNCRVPIVPQPGELLLEALGDDYLLSKAEDDGWAREYDVVFDRLREKVREEGKALRPLVELIRAGQVEITVPPIPEELPRRYVASAKTPVIHVMAGGVKWLIVTDSLPATLRQTLQGEAAHCDVLVLPEISRRSYYLDMINTAVARSRPKVVYIPGDRVPRDFDARKWAADHNSFELVTGWNDGALVGKTIGPETKLKTLFSDRKIVL